MYERSYGYRYAELGDHPAVADIARAIRADIKQATEEGLLPTRWSYSVRSDSFSGGSSINVEVRDCIDAWKECDGMNCRNVWCAARNDPKYAHAATRHDVLTEEAAAARMTLERIHNAYNHDGSEIQVDYFDVRYYGHVNFEDARSAAFRAKERQRLETRKQSRESGRVVGRVANYKRDGSRIVHLLVEGTDGEKVLACGARVWSRSLIGKVADDVALTCSRCKAKSAV